MNSPMPCLRMGIHVFFLLFFANTLLKVKKMEMCIVVFWLLIDLIYKSYRNCQAVVDSF